MRFYACCIDVKRVPMALKRPSITSMKSLNFHLIYFLKTTLQEMLPDSERPECNQIGRF